jgi:hypothetical protein
MQPVHGPMVAVDALVLSKELETVDVVFKKWEGLPEGKYSTVEGIIGRWEAFGESLVAFCSGLLGGGAI